MNMKTGELEKKDASLLSITSSSTTMHERVTQQWNLIKPAFILLADTKQQMLEASRLAAVNYC